MTCMYNSDKKHVWKSKIYDVTLLCIGRRNACCSYSNIPCLVLFATRGYWSHSGYMTGLNWGNVQSPTMFQRSPTLTLICHNFHQQYQNFNQGLFSSPWYTTTDSLSFYQMFSHIPCFHGIWENGLLAWAQTFCNPSILTFMSSSGWNVILCAYFNWTNEWITTWQCKGWAASCPIKFKNSKTRGSYTIHIYFNKTLN